MKKYRIAVMDYLEYLRSFIDAGDTIDRITRESSARDDIQPFVEPETGRFLAFLVRLKKASAVLELGTGIGNSAIWMGEAIREWGGELVTVDNHPRTKSEAEKNIGDAGLKNTVRMITENAEEAVSRMTAQGGIEFDLIFQDCGKYLYPMLHDSLVALLKPGGILVADDTLFHVNENVRKNLGRYTDEYNRKVFSDTRLYSVILPVGHGLTISIKK